MTTKHTMVFLTPGTAKLSLSLSANEWATVFNFVNQNKDPIAIIGGERLMRCFHSLLKQAGDRAQEINHKLNGREPTEDEIAYTNAARVISQAPPEVLARGLDTFAPGASPSVLSELQGMSKSDLDAMVRHVKEESDRRYAALYPEEAAQTFLENVQPASTAAN